MFIVQAVAKGLLGSVLIDLDGGGPIPPARLVCRLDEASETVVTEVEHDLKEETKVDGFQEPGSFSQRITYHASEEVRINFNIANPADSSHSCFVEKFKISKFNGKTILTLLRPFRVPIFIFCIYC